MLLDKEDPAPVTSLAALVASPHVFSSTLCQGATTDSSCVPSYAAPYALAPPTTGSISCQQKDPSPLLGLPGQTKDVSEPTARTGTIDVGNCFGKGRPDDFTRSQLLENHWQAPKRYVYPSSPHKKKGKFENRFVREERLFKYPWLILSDARRELFCRYCLFFVVGRVGGYQHNVPLNTDLSLLSRSCSENMGL